MIEERLERHREVLGKARPSAVRAGGETRRQLEGEQRSGAGAGTARDARLPTRRGRRGRHLVSTSVAGDLALDMASTPSLAADRSTVSGGRCWCCWVPASASWAARYLTRRALAPVARWRRPRGPLSSRGIFASGRGTTGGGSGDLEELAVLVNRMLGAQPGAGAKHARGARQRRPRLRTPLTGSAAAARSLLRSPGRRPGARRARRTASRNRARAPHAADADGHLRGGGRDHAPTWRPAISTRHRRRDHRFLRQVAEEAGVVLASRPASRLTPASTASI